MTDTYNPDAKYTVIRKYAKGHADVIVDTGLTLAEARAHCADPETSSRTALGPGKLEHTAKFGPWFDSYYEEDGSRYHPATRQEIVDAVNDAMTGDLGKVIKAEIV